jgi:hypothetical protein
MNRRQKDILINTTVVLVVTATAVAAMINLKNWVNRSESMRAMEHLSRMVSQYRVKYSRIPPESYIDDIREDLEGRARLGKVIYRAQWINFESKPDEVLAYTEQPHNSWLYGKQNIVIRLDGRVEWMDKKELDKLLAKQQSSQEIEMLHKESKQASPPSSDFTFGP